jgi:hypothetical protein
VPEVDTPLTTKLPFEAQRSVLKRNDTVPVDGTVARRPDRMRSKD